MASPSASELPSISIVVTVYNSESTINECLRCIYKLDYPTERLEIIVVDDGSTDRTVQKVKDYPAKLILKEHGGYPSSMNAGIKEAKGDIILIVDSDTYVEQDYLIKILGEFEDQKVGIASGYVATKPNAKFWARIVGFESEARYDQMKSNYVDFITSTCTAYRREVFEQVGLFNKELKRGSDEDLAQRASKAGWKIVLRKDAVCYHDWVSSVKKYFKKQMANGIYEINNFLRHPELLRGREQHPPSLYVPMLLTSVVLLVPICFLLGVVWVSLLAFLGLVLYHIPQTIRIIKKQGDWSMLLFPVVFNLRYVAWLFGIGIGLIREVKSR
jgi:cellulose synthase/poly-beta-1,6-N-acetylglucosamine synthase-like glycosyltransferase